MRPEDTSALSCSFCHKSQDTVAQLISSPNDYPRAYICDECINVCAAILEDSRARSAGFSAILLTAIAKHPLLTHRLASSLLSAVERWIRRESLGEDAAPELAELRRVAVEMMGE